MRIPFKNNIVETPIIGQEVICPDGLGRIREVVSGAANSYQIRVDTYVNNMACKWASTNVEYLPITNRLTAEQRPISKLPDDAKNISMPIEDYKFILNGFEEAYHSLLNSRFQENDSNFAVGITKLQDNITRLKRGRA
jgi:hypothetical protein